MLASRRERGPPRSSEILAIAVKRGDQDPHAIRIFDLDTEALEVADYSDNGHNHLPIGGGNFFCA